MINAIKAPRIDTKLLSYYLWAGASLAAALVVYALFNLPSRYLYLVAAVPVAFIIVVSPRLALYQFMFVLFIEYPLVPSVPLTLMDFSAGLVILSGLLDILTGNKLPRRLPALVSNYGIIVLVVMTAGLFGYWPELAVRPLVRLLLLTATMLALIQLMSRVLVSSLIKGFFVLAVVHSAYVVFLFLLAGGGLRVFGFAHVLFDDQAMVALPIGVALYLWSPRRQAPALLLGSLVILGGLVATQSRAPIVMALVGCFVLVWVSVRKARRLDDLDDLSWIVGQRVFGLAVGAFCLVVVTVVLMPDLLSAVLTRFERLFSWQPSGSVLYRVVLAERALTAFADHPWLGVGPGGFKHLYELYGTLHLAPAFYNTRHLSAHNLMLHYLAETGVAGGLALIALIVNQFRLAGLSWGRCQGRALATGAALFSWATIFAVSTLVEAGWMWGQLSFLAVFFAALVARQYQQTVASTPVQIGHQS